MSKEEIIELLKNEIDKIDDYDDKADYLVDIIKELYDYIRVDDNENVDPRIEEFENVLESTNEMIINEQYEDVINLLTPYQSLVEELQDISSLDLDKLEVCCFFNEPSLFFVL